MTDEILYFDNAFISKPKVKDWKKSSKPEILLPE